MHELPKLTYSFDSLEPYIDKLTMEIHYAKHHAAYVSNLNKALEGSGFEQLTVNQILTKLDELPENIRTAVRNNAGGHFNHSLFWKLLNINGAKVPTGELLSKINETFGTYENFKAEFSKAAMSRFGSGWAWLALSPSNELKVYSTPNQDNPILVGDKPLLALDVWEHAYYLKYQNRRQDYVDNFWNIIDWDSVSASLYDEDRL